MGLIAERDVAVPKTVINERIEIIGAVPEAQFLGEVMKTQAT